MQADTQPVEGGPFDSLANPTSGFDAYQRRSYFPELDGIRAISVLMVVAFHIKSGIWGWLSGELGVNIFFVLSGYLITMLAIREERARGAVNLKAFYIRRFFRLFPLYYFVLALYCVLILGLGIAPEKRGLLASSLPYYLIYFQEWPFFQGLYETGRLAPFGHTWTLGIEEKFYLVWPLFAFVMLKGLGKIRFLGTVVLTGLTIASALVSSKLGYFIQPYAHILIGCATAFLLEDRATYNRLAWLGRPRVAIAFVAAFLLFQMGIGRIPDPWNHGLRFVYSFMVAVTMVVILMENGPIQRTLQRPTLVAIGRLSYGMYLIQFLVLNLVEKKITSYSGNPFVSVVSLVVTCALTITAARILSIIVEQPGRLLGRRISDSIQRRAQSQQVRVDPKDLAGSPGLVSGS
ncbi:acyltransferase family protein [Singulisphaera sp. PoT]|uniref:acyltransferase family protein n=1 Tax=Singulisphaera sp. PoT TaxID=3411797 RepID=UPI003BF4D5E8